jgi:hypothetical protein
MANEYLGRTDIDIGGVAMATCEFAIPIRSTDSFPYQATSATCMRCGEQFVSYARGGSLTEQTCGCGVAYRVETLTMDVVACGDDVIPANEHYFRTPVVQL